MKLNIIYLILIFLLSFISCSGHKMTRESGLQSLALLRYVIPNAHQNTSTIIGQVRDRECDDPILGVNIWLEGTKLGAVPDSLGNYTIKDIPKGVYNIRASFPAYHRVSVDSIKINGNEIIVLDFRLAQEGVRIDS